MGSYVLRFLGYDTGFDPFNSNSQSMALTPTSTPLPDFPINDQNQFYASSGNLNENTPMAPNSTPNPSDIVPQVAQIQATYPPLPTYTPYPTQRAIYGSVIAVGYSYYFPPLGPPNCSDANWHEVYCDDITASGLPWTKYISQGVAVPYEWRDWGWVDFGDTIRVHTPYDMVGDYIVLDTCGDCIKKEGHVYLDFLDNRARLNWTVPMLVEIIRK